MSIEIITRTAKRYYEELYLQNTAIQFFATIFGILDESTDSAFLLDSLIGSPYAIGYRPKNGESGVRNFQPGKGQLIEVPVASEKTPITESLLDKVIAGVDADGGFGQNEANLIGKIIRQHTSAVNMTKNYQALQLFSNGIFEAKAADGSDLGLDISFTRDASLTLTADFAVISITQAFANIQAAALAKGTPQENQCLILGANWQAEFSKNAEVQSFMQNNGANVNVSSDMMPPLFLNTEGLAVIARYRAPGMNFPLWLLSYQPAVSYVPSEGASSVPYVDADEALFFALSDERFRVNRGVNVIDGSGKRERAVGDLVIDTFSDNDPVTEYIRSNTRHVFVPANIDHTAKSTGSNFN